MNINLVKIGTLGVMAAVLFFVFFKIKSESILIAGFEKEVLENVLKITGVTYDGTIDDLVKQTQKAWIRPAGKERWEMEEISEDKRHELMPLFGKLGLVDECKSTKKSYEYILFMGGTVSRMALRMETLKELLVSEVQYQNIVFLSGCRYLTDNEKQFLSDKKWDPIATTEFGIYPKLFEEYQIPVNKIVAINAPETVRSNGTTYRPTTADTVECWLQTNPLPGSVVIISSQPFCHYQKIVTESLLPSSFAVSVVGVESPADTIVANYLDTIARTLYQWVSVTLKKNK